MTTSTTLLDTFRIGGDLPVHRLGYGTLQLTGLGHWDLPAAKRRPSAITHTAGARHGRSGATPGRRNSGSRGPRGER